MIYIGKNGSVIRFGSSSVTVSRDISFVITDPEKWDTREFLEILWEKAGAIINKVVLLSTYRNPDTHELSHCYRLQMSVTEPTCKAGLSNALTREDVNKIISEIEDTLEDRLGTKFYQRHRAIYASNVAVPNPRSYYKSILDSDLHRQYVSGILR